MPGVSRRQFNARFLALSRRPQAELTKDEQRSLRFFSADAELTEGTCPADSVDRIVVWLRNIRAVEEFVRQHGRLPRDNRRPAAAAVNARERKLEQWLNYQRRHTTADLHCSYQTERLRLIPGLTESSFDSLWAHHLHAYEQFLAATGRAPRLRSDSITEQQLARWAAKQRLAKRRRKLPPERGAALEGLGFWAWGRPPSAG